MKAALAQAGEAAAEAEARAAAALGATDEVGQCRFTL